MEVVKINKLEDIIEGIPRILSKGAYGTVFRCVKKDDLQLYAFKVLFKGESRYKNTSIQREKLALEALDHPNIIKLMGIFENSEDVFFMLEYADRRDLKYWIKRINHGNGLPREVVKYWAAEQILVLEYLRSQGFVHRDLKSDNIMISHTFHSKLTDFGTAKHIKDSNGMMLQDKNSYVGTYMFLAPEVMKPGPVTFGTDLWGIAVLLSEMYYKQIWVCEKIPQESYQGWCKRIDRRRYYFPGQDKWPALEDLMYNLARSNPEERLGIHDMTELKSHRIWDGIEWDRHFQTPPPVTKPPPPHVLDNIFNQIDPIPRRKPWELEKNVKTYQEGIFDTDDSTWVATPERPQDSDETVIAQPQAFKRIPLKYYLHRELPRVMDEATKKEPSYYSRVTASARRQACPVHTLPIPKESDEVAASTSDPTRRTPPASPVLQTASSRASLLSPRKEDYATPPRSPATPPREGRVRSESAESLRRKRTSTFYSTRSHLSPSPVASQQEESIFESPPTGSPVVVLRRSSIVTSSGKEVEAPVFKFDLVAWRKTQSPPPEVAIQEMQEERVEQSKCCCNIS